jgi:hypothetical protein
MPDYGDKDIEPDMRAIMEQIARTLDAIFNPEKKRTTGFILLTFPFGDVEGRCNYMSNGVRREDVVTLLKEQVARFEGRYHSTEGKA